VTALQFLEILALGLVLGGVMGMLGGGGGVLAVPLLVFVLGLSVAEATTLSLAVILVAALAALVPHTRAGTVRWRQGLVFGAVGAVGAIAGSLASSRVPERLLLAGFAILVLAAGVAMLRGAQAQPAVEAGDPNWRPTWIRIAVLATLVGLATGFFGVGGGFLVVPALILALRMPVHEATATGLVVITINALVSLGTRAADQAAVDWALLGALAGAAAIGGVLGALAARRIAGAVLRRLFGGLMVAVAAFLALQVALS
jgi:uncharacterized membrane protein YfcA